MTLQNKPKKTLAALVGAAAAGLLMVVVPQFEGTILRGYLDPIGIATKCMGDTTNVVVGKAYTMAECQASLETQLIKHAEPVLACTPQIAGNAYQTVAAVSLAYNIGVTAYCKSGTAQAFRAGNPALACKRINESDTGKPQWITAGGKVLPGLVKRRAIERKLCEGKTV